MSYEQQKIIIEILSFLVGAGIFAYIGKVIYKVYRHITWIHGEGFKILKGFESKFGKTPAEVIHNIAKKLADNQTKDGMRIDIVEENLNLGIFVCDKDGRWIWSNRFLSKLFSASEEQTHGLNWISMVKDPQKVLVNWKFAIENQIPYRDEIIVLSQKDEEIKEITCEARAEMSCSDGICVGWVGYIQEKS
jgi:PAS domain-containing protein